MRALTLILVSVFWVAGAPQQPQPEGFPVTIDRKEVMRIRAGLGPVSPEDRAKEVEERISALMARESSRKIEIRVVPFEDKALVMSGSTILLVVGVPDAALEKTTPLSLANRRAEAIERAIAQFREKRSWLSFTIALSKSLAAWIAFSFFVWLVVRSFGWIRTRIESWFARKAQARGFSRMLWERAAKVALGLLKIAIGIVFLFQLSFLLSYSLGLFPQTEGISTTLLDYLSSTFGAIANAVLAYLPNGGVVIIVCILTHYLVKVLRFLADLITRGELRVRGFHPEMAHTTYQLVRILVVIFALVVVFPYLPGGQSDVFKGVSIFIGVLISFGSGSSISNILAGVVLTYMRPFRLGDRVKIADTLGDVLDKNLLVTRLRTIKNEEVVIPNSSILGNQIYNYSAMARNRGLILYSTVTLSYDAPWRTVHQLLIQAALSTPGILTDPAPFVLETSLNDFHISYQINAYTDRPNEFEFTYSRLHENIQELFNKAGVEIMSPTYLSLRDGNTVTIPAAHRPPDYEPPGFRVKT